MTKKKYPCELNKHNGEPCDKSYDTKEQLHSHHMANHWKQLK